MPLVSESGELVYIRPPLGSRGDFRTLFTVDITVIVRPIYRISKYSTYKR